MGCPWNLTAGFGKRCAESFDDSLLTHRRGERVVVYIEITFGFAQVVIPLGCRHRSPLLERRRSRAVVGPQDALPPDGSGAWQARRRCPLVEIRKPVGDPRQEGIGVMLKAGQVANVGARWIRDRRPRLEHGHDTAGFGEPARNDGADGSTADDHDVAPHHHETDLVLFPRVTSRVQDHNGIRTFNALLLDVAEGFDVLVQLLVGRWST
jgi:hypothetical protein